jgi:hypothetical protein
MSYSVCRLGVSHLVTVTHQDVCGKLSVLSSSSSSESVSTSIQSSINRSFPGVEETSIDAVFLDLPEPWLALDAATKLLKPGKSICCYSPCMEQVMQTVSKLRALSYHSIRMIEVRQCPYDGRMIKMETLDLGLGSEEATRKNEKSLYDDTVLSHYHSIPIKSDEEVEAEVLQKIGNQENENNDDHPKNKRVKTSATEFRGKDGDEIGSMVEIDDTKEQEDGVDENPHLLKRIRNRPKTNINGYYEMSCARPIFSMKGHTAFLTFAIKATSSSL